jgi:hypothetical protein
MNEQGDEPSDTADGLPSEMTQAVVRLAPVAFIAGSVVFMLFAPLVAFVTGLFTGFGNSVHPPFYTTIAQVLPIIVIASVTADGFRRLIETQKASPLEPILDLTSIVVVFIVGEGCALYAVATQTSTTFLLLVPCLAAFSAVTDIMNNVLIAAGVRKPHGTAQSRMEEQLKRMLEKRRAQS